MLREISKKLNLMLKYLLNTPLEKELLKRVQQHLLMLGINLDKNSQKNPLNQRNLQSVFVFATGTVSCYVYTFHLADRIEEIILAICVLATVVGNFVVFLYIFWKADKFIKFFIDISQNMQERKCTSF